MKMHSTHCIRYHAGRVQELAFYAAMPCALAFTGFAIYGLARVAVVAAILGSLAIGASVGAWVVGARFKD